MKGINTTAGAIMGEHYEAQVKYAEMLFNGLNISSWHFIKKFKAFSRAEKFRNAHKKCCEWANEKD